MQMTTRPKANIKAQILTLFIAIALLFSACSNDSKPQQGSFEVKNTDVSRIELEPTKKPNDVKGSKKENGSEGTASDE